MRFEDYSKNGIKIAFNCPTKNMADFLFSILLEIGYKWCFFPTLRCTFWSIAKENTWYYLYPNRVIAFDREFNHSCLAVNIFEIEDFTDAICKYLFVL